MDLRDFELSTMLGQECKHYLIAISARRPAEAVPQPFLEFEFYLWHLTACS
jgi:hypothetical protein